VVGDADQSIYAFRGATIRNIMQFEEDYPQARTILLEQNYRSTQTILSAANAVISRNLNRKREPLDRLRHGWPCRVRRDQRARRGLVVAQTIDELSDAATPSPRTSPSLPDERTVPGVREVFIASGCPTRWSGGALLRAPQSP